MSLDLIAINRNQPEDMSAIHWQAILKFAPDHGMISIDDSVVTKLARLLDDQELSNGQVVTAYAWDDEDPMGSLVCAFGPCLLPEPVLAQVRETLASSENGESAVKLLDEVVRLRLQIRFSGKDHHAGAHVKGINWPADDVQINRSSGNMYHMLRNLGIEAGPDLPCEIEFAPFEDAVRLRGHLTDMPAQLEALVAAGRRQQATHLYWA